MSLVLTADGFLHAMENMAPGNLVLSSPPSSNSTSNERGFLPLWLQPENNLELRALDQPRSLYLTKPITKPTGWGNMTGAIKSPYPPLSLECVFVRLFYGGR